MRQLLCWLNPSQDGARAVCFAFSIIFLGIAIVAPKPWSESRLDRLDSHRTLRPIDHAAGVLMPTALGAASLAFLLGCLSGLWAGEKPRPGAERVAQESHVERKPVPRWFLVGLFLAASLTLALRVPLATKSLWWDEIWTLKHAVSGYWTQDERVEGGMRFIERDWPRTLWYYAKPTNHVGFSILSRGSLESWRAITDSGRDAFQEWVIRLPSLLASAGAVILVGIIAKITLGAPAGLLAAVLLAVHPWFVRYGVEARGFGLNVCFAAWFALCWLQIVRQRKSWSWVIGLGFSSAWLVLTFPYNLFLPISGAGSLVLMAALMRQREAWLACSRSLGGLLLAGACVAVVASPWVPQALEWTDVQGEAMAGPRLDRAGMIQAWTSFLTGLPLEAGHGEEAKGIPDLQGAVEAFPWIAVFVFGLLPFAMIMGLLVGPKTFSGRMLGVMWITSALLALVVALLKQHYFYERYLIYALPVVPLGLTGAVVVGSRLFAGLVGSVRMRRHAGMVGASLSAIFLLGPLTLLQLPQVQLLMQRPIAPIADMADYFVEQVLHQDAEAIVLGFGLGGDLVQIYLPRTQVAFTLEEMEKAITDAEETGRALWVYFGYSTFSRANRDGRANEVFALLDDRSLFEEVATFSGVEAQFYYRILRFLGKQVDSSGRGD